MPTVLGSLRRLALTPSLAEVTFTKRGFPDNSPAVAAELEAIPHSVICGFEWGIDTRSQWELERRLRLVRPDLLGFAYEGATMACTILDAMRGGRGHKTADLLRGPGEPHIFLAYIGIGFAMARLPRPLWSKVLPDLDSRYHPTMSWLALDGYGFDRAYFQTRRWVDEQRVADPYPWQGCPEYSPRAIDQGIGRALWFIHSAQPAAVAAAVRRFAEHRQADLWSGVGLAATFAGGCPPDGMAELRRTAGEHRPEVALGMVFAVKARAYSGFLPDHTELAAQAFGDVPTGTAVEIADSAEVHENGSAKEPAYELWRQKIRANFGHL